MSTLPLSVEPTRVILVGRTGLDHDLRREPNVELGRARTPLDAIGEFAEISETDDARRASVIVGPGSLPADQAEVFVNALRKIDPGVRLIGMGDVNGSRELFDTVLPAAATGEQARRAIAGEFALAPTTTGVEAVEVHLASTTAAAAAAAAIATPAARAMPTPPPSVPTAPPVQSTPASVPTATTSAPAATTANASATFNSPAARKVEPGIDGSLATPPALAAMLSGLDPIAAAVDELSSRLGVTCKFSAGEAESLADAAASVRVSHSGRTLGWLRAPGVDRSIVEQEAARIAGWVLLAAQHDQLRRAAFTDELTGAFNRRYFNRFLAAALDQAKAKRHSVTLLVFDIDNFKTYNDKYSHAAGDEILVEAVRLLTSVIRPSDRVCRVGGDEFAVIFHDPEGPRNPGVAASTPQSIGLIATRFQKQICAHRFPKLLDEAPGTLTISGGLATFPWDGATPEELLARADELAMQSKRQGKNSITFGPGAMQVCKIGESEENAKK